MRQLLVVLALVACGETELPPEQPEGVCGDGNVDTGEECDGDLDCSPECTIMFSCGDGIVDEQTETCDDGNSVSGDGCSDVCHVEEEPIRCEARAPITCEQGVMGNASDAGATMQLAEYNCSSNTFPGGEFVFEFIAPASGPVLLSADLGGNAFVIDGEQDCGQPASCVAHIGSPEFTAIAGQRYLVVVEPLPMGGPYFINLRCD